MIKKLLEPFRNPTNFSKNVAKVTSGSALAAIIYFVGIKLITSIYDPEVFGNYGLLTSIVTIFSAVATFKYEAAIPLPDQLSDRFHTAWASLVALVVFVALMGAFFLVVGEWLLNVLKAETLLPYIHLIVLGIFAKGLFQMGQLVLLSWKEFTRLSQLKVIQAVIVQAIAVGYGLYIADLMGLYLGFLVGNIVAGLISVGHLLRSIKQVDVEHLKLMVYRYRKFPAINTPATLINSFSAQLPVLMLSRYYGPESVGFYTIAVKLIDSPMNIVAQSVSQVYLKAASDAFNSGKKALRKTYWNTVEKMALIGIVPVIVAAIFSPWVVTIILGAEWKTSGYIVQLLLLMKYVQFINLPVSSTYAIINKQEIALYLVSISIIIRFFAMYFFRYNEFYMITALSVAGALFYVMYNVLIYLSIKNLPSKSP